METADAFARAIAQFNGGEFFDCHETLEPLWQSASGHERVFLHALIQAAVALHHHQRGNLNGALSVARRANQKLASLPSQQFGDVSQPLSHALQVFFADAVQTPGKALIYPQIQLSNEY